jgi:anti-sigma regulatory factor (Ser/Thr protein kinase)
LPRSEQLRILSDMTAGQLLELDAAFEVWANDGQVEPICGGWNTWLMLAGRGFGKTRAGAEWILALAASRQARAGSVAAAAGIDGIEVGGIEVHGIEVHEAMVFQGTAVRLQQVVVRPDDDGRLRIEIFSRLAAAADAAWVLHATAWSGAGAQALAAGRGRPGSDADGNRYLLHPALLDDLGLPATVDWYLRGFSRRHGVHAELLQCNMSERLAPEIEASSYRIIQEALTNIAKHARAGTCRVYLQRLPTTLLLTVEDDGVGFEERPRDSRAGLSGLGLIGIRERASHLGGTAGIESAPGRGTRITVELPARSRTASGERSDLPADALPENDEKAVVNG